MTRLTHKLSDLLQKELTFKSPLLSQKSTNNTMQTTTLRTLLHVRAHDLFGAAQATGVSKYMRRQRSALGPLKSWHATSPVFLSCRSVTFLHIPFSEPAKVLYFVRTVYVTCAPAYYQPVKLVKYNPAMSTLTSRRRRSAPCSRYIGCRGHVHRSSVTGMR